MFYQKLILEYLKTFSVFETLMQLPIELFKCTCLWSKKKERKEKKKKKMEKSKNSDTGQCLGQSRKVK